MAFFRFNRDKRGYEHFYLVEPTTNRRGKVKPRVLYWFRSPPGVRVGREPFDEGVRRALEAQNPGVTFDWRSIVEAPIPSADADKWRERRRVERAAKQALSAPDIEDEAADAIDGDSSSDGAPSPETAVAAAPNEPASQNGVDPARKRRRRRRGRRPGAPAPAEASGEPRDAEEDESLREPRAAAVEPSRAVEGSRFDETGSDSDENGSPSGEKTEPSGD
jgi:hypothetical protein